MDFSKHYGINVNPIGLAGAFATKYTRQVNEHLTWMYRTETGRILLKCIRFHGVPVEIRPYTRGDCNAIGGGELVAGSLRGFAEYSPDTFSLHGACPVNKIHPNRGLLWDEILFHELVHVFRNVSRNWLQQRLVGGLYWTCPHF